jgi:SsrA-binding protein
MEIIKKNKEANFEYFIIEKYTAGIKLYGSEVKSIRKGNVSMDESYCYIKDDEIFIKSLHISENKESGKYDNHDPIRVKKLLMKKKEILNLKSDVEKKGNTIVPLCIMMSDTGFIKVEIAICKGKHTYDKRNTIKERDVKKDLERELKLSK